MDLSLSGASEQGSLTPLARLAPGRSQARGDTEGLLRKSETT